MIPEITIYLARFWGSLFIILGVSAILFGFLNKVIKYTEDKTITISTGYTTFLLGLFTIVFHQLWVWDWRVSVTILGWITFFKGAEKVMFPKRINRKAKMFRKKSWLYGLIILLIGIWFFLMSFI